MPASLATFLTVSFVAALLIWDIRRKEGGSSALWLPIIWLLIVGSRFPSQWMQLGSPSAVANVADGSPLDALFFAMMILVGSVVLITRRIFTADLLRQNVWLVALLVFGFLSIVWSDFPFIALKRWIKTLGHPVMALIVLTDPKPMQALRTVMVRAAAILLPFSVLFVKYLPEFGRGFDPWTGVGYFSGVMLTKNDLGYVCMIFGVFFLWNILSRSTLHGSKVRRDEVLVSGLFLGLVAYLLGLANSATSVATLTIGAITLFGLGSKFVSRKNFGFYLIAVCACLLIIEATFGLYEEVIRALGRDASLTDRSEVWTDAIALQSNPVLGLGFESFWLGSRLDWMSAKWWWQPNQAHNGYIEIYLNLGFVGLLLFTALVISTFRRASSGLSNEARFEFSRLRLALLFAILAHNYTEATFKGVHLLWTVFHMVALNVPDKNSSAKRSDVVRVDRMGRPLNTSAGRHAADGGMK